MPPSQTGSGEAAKARCCRLPRGTGDPAASPWPELTAAPGGDGRAGGAAPVCSEQEGGRGAPPFAPGPRAPTPAAALRAQRGGRLEHR